MQQFTNPIETEDALLLGTGAHPSTPAWRATIKAVYGAELTAEERAVYTHLSDGAEPPEGGATKAYVCAGRRGGKSSQLARVILHEVTQVPHGVCLAPGQLGIFGILSTVRGQAQQILDYLRGLVNAVPALKRQLVPKGDQVESLTFKNGIRVAVLTADQTSVRSATLIGCVIDESAWLPTTGTDSDVALIGALKPGLLPLAGAPRRRLFLISSAGLRKGYFYNRIQEYRGRTTPGVVAVLGTTLDFNPFVNRSELAADEAEDPALYKREVLSVFSDAITEGFLVPDLAGAVDTDRTGPLPYVEGLRYFIGTDASFGSGDGFGICVSTARYQWADERRETKIRRVHIHHCELHTPQPGRPLGVHNMVEAVRGVCHRYNTPTCFIDQHNSHVFRELLAAKGVRAKIAPWTATGVASKTARFSAIRDALRSGELRLPNDRTLLAELSNLKTTTLPSGVERIEAASGHDDLAHAFALSVSECLAAKAARFADADLTWYEREQADRRTWRNLGYAGYGPPCNRRA